MSGVFLGAFVLLLYVFLAVAGLIITHRVVSNLHQSHTTAIGIIYGALHVTFGVIIGFSAYLVLNKYTAAENTVASEAGAPRWRFTGSLNSFLNLSEIRSGNSLRLMSKS